MKAFAVEQRRSRLTEKKKVFTDVVWSILALGVMHGVLQIVVYPYLNHKLGADDYGDILYVLAILGILAPSIGLAANNTRLIQRRDIAVENGDLLLAMLPQLGVAALIFSMLVFPYVSGTGDMVLALLTLGFTMLRNYGGVEYRMTLNFRGYFLYYLTISIGYLLGVALFPLTNNWILCFLLGELFCFVLVAARGHIYWPLTLTGNWKLVFRSTVVLASSYLLYNTVLYLDRLLLQNLMDSETVTVYYVASLLGKTAALLVGPLNGVIIGHLTKEKNRITQGQFVKATGMVIAAGSVLYIGILMICPIFTRLLYPNIADAVLEIAWLANLSQILCFVASPILTVMLTFCSPKWNLAVQIIYAILFVPSSFLGVRAIGLWGFVAVGLVVNFFRVALVFAVGMYQIKKISREE